MDIPATCTCAPVGASRMRAHPARVPANTAFVIYNSILLRYRHMKIRHVIYRGLLLLCLIPATSPVQGHPAAVVCGEIITADTTLTADLACPAGTVLAITINAPDITLDLGGHTISGDPYEVGVMVNGYSGITIKNGTIAGFNDGIFLIDSDDSVVEHLTINNLTIDDWDHFVFGVHIVDSQNVIVRYMQFEFLRFPHKEAVEVYASDVSVSHIAVLGGGAGVSFSFAGTCDPLNGPSNGTVSDSTFTDIYVAGVWIACSSDLLIEDNVFSTTPGECSMMGIQGDPPTEDAVTGTIIRNNTFHDLIYGLNFRGMMDSSTTNNSITHNQSWGILMEHSLGCIDPVHNPGWTCFNSTGNTITDNFVVGNGADLYHDEDSSGNTWERNVCRVKVGAEIPDCIPPSNLSLPLILHP
jgi:hypothetical protein